MEFLIVVSLIILLIIVLRINNKISEEMRSLHYKIDGLKTEIETLGSNKQTTFEENKTKEHSVPPIVITESKPEEEILQKDYKEDEVHEAFPKLVPVSEEDKA
jgi:Sec-independent protein translocase protein TatA